MRQLSIALLAGFTVLAASNRPVALARADRVLEL